MEGDAWTDADPTLCPICHREACEEHLPPSMDEGPAAAGSSNHAVRVGLAVEVERVRREARRLVDAEERPPEAIPALVTLRERLAHGTPRPRWRIQQWQAHNSRIMAVAQFKAGKTTLRDNVVRSLVDGDPFLGRDAVECGERAAEHVIAAAEHAGALERPEIVDVFDDAEGRRIARGIAA